MPGAASTHHSSAAAAVESTRVCAPSTAAVARRRRWVAEHADAVVPNWVLAGTSLSFLLPCLMLAPWPCGFTSALGVVAAATASASVATWVDRTRLTVAVVDRALAYVCAAVWGGAGLCTMPLDSFWWAAAPMWAGIGGFYLLSRGCNSNAPHAVFHLFVCASMCHVAWHILLAANSSAATDGVSEQLSTSEVRA